MLNPLALKPGAILFLEREIPALPYPTGYWVLCKLTDATATLSLLDQTPTGTLCPLPERFDISVEDLDAFTLTAETAVVDYF